MRGLVITPEGPPQPDRAAGGQRRLSLFVQAAMMGSTTTEVLHIVAPGEATTVSRTPAGAPFAGPIVRSCVEIRRAPTKTFWSHYGAGFLTARGHPSYWAFCGAEQARAVRECLTRRPDFVVVHRLAAMLTLLCAGVPDCPILFDFDDVEHKAWLRAILARPIRLGTLAEMAQLPAMHFAERRAVAHAQAVSVCSETDRAYLVRLGLGTKVTVVPNAVTLPPDPGPLCSDPTLMFLGSYHHAPNIVAAERLVTQIWPLVLARVPAARLLVAGSPAHALASARRPPPQVEYLGFVEDLAGLYGRSRVVVCPITIGGGTRVKLVEAGAFGKPMVSTRIGAEGLCFANGKEILLRESDKDIADACVKLLTDDQACQRLGAAARRAAVSIYDDHAVTRQIQEILGRITRRRG